MRVWIASESPIRKVVDVAKELGYRVYKVYQGVEEEL
jgi:H2-forming N5,N10-methylenetetrahydromethanopterin dehydrogenase-like enzyme